jgi:hypothetical protein
MGLSGALRGRFMRDPASANFAEFPFHALE